MPTTTTPTEVPRPGPPTTPVPTLLPTPRGTTTGSPGAASTAGPRTSWTAGGATLEAEYAGSEVTLRLVAAADAGPGSAPDPDAAGRLLCAVVGHVRRRHTRRVHCVMDLTCPAGWTLLVALRSRVGIDVGAIAMRRAGSSVMVTVDLLPAAAAVGTVGYTPTGGLPGRRPLDDGVLPSPTRPRDDPGTRP